jgi:hypothetical protein
MHAPPYWKLRKGVVATSSNLSCFHHPNGAVNFLSAVSKKVPKWSNCQQLKEVTHMMENGQIL